MDTAKIYTIKNKLNPELVYVGSTKETLKLRLARHRAMAKYKPHFLLYQEIAKNKNLWDEWDIELYEEYPCNNRIDLCKREGEIIREIGTLNKRIAGRTKKEYKQDNAEIIKIKQKQYREDNKEKIKNYRDEHTEKMRLYQKSYLLKKKI